MSEIKLKIKESWSEVSIEDYIKLSSLDNDLIGIIELFTNADRKTLEQIDADEMEIINQHLGWVNNQPSADVIIKEFKAGGDTYKYEREFNKLTLGEVVTFEMLTESNNLSHLQTIPLFLAVVLRKVDSKGKAEEWNADFVSERVTLFEKQLNIAEVMAIFFCLTHKGQTPIEHLDSSMVELRTLRDQIMNM